MGVNILVAHGGGPTAVINTSLQGVVEGARQSGKVDKIYAARFGAEGILKGDLIDLTDVPSSTIAKLAHTPAEVVDAKYVATEATTKAAATLYKSCSVCGEKSNETFAYGELAAHTFKKIVADEYKLSDAT